MPDKVYALRRNGIEHGTVYTNEAVVNFMLNEVGYTSDRNLKDVRLLDPAAGDGVFIINAIDRLFQSSATFKFDFASALNSLKAIELDTKVAERLRSKIEQYCQKMGIRINSSVLNSVVVNADFLLVPNKDLGSEYEIIIGNPPYIRHEQIPEEKRTRYRALFETFRHRSDIYIAFYEKSLKLLSDKGRVCFICSNRWMKTKYGEALRKLIASHHSLDAIIDINDRSAFDQDVDAYASVTLISRGSNPRKYFYYELIDSLTNLRPIVLSNEHGLNIVKKPNDGDWHIGETRSFNLSATYKSIEEQGYKMGIGVASGADKIFISDNLPIEKELQIPIVTAREIMNGEINWTGKFIFNPYAASGGLVDLDKYPNAKTYLEQHADVLKQRHTAKKSNANAWYKTIDRIYPELASRPKLLIPDMKRDGLFPIDKGRLYPHHNIYYVTHSDIDSLKLLGAFLISDFCKEQINLVSVKMRGGFSRWQSQNLRKIVLPDIQHIQASIKKNLISAYESKDIVSINKLVDQVISTTL